MHVYYEGAYHRRTPDLRTTSCGHPIHSEFCDTRREELKHPLSRDCGCFTEYELDQADLRQEAEAREEDQATGRLTLVDPPEEGEET